MISSVFGFGAHGNAAVRFFSASFNAEKSANISCPFQPALEFAAMLRHKSFAAPLRILKSVQTPVGSLALVAYLFFPVPKFDLQTSPRFDCRRHIHESLAPALTARIARALPQTTTWHIEIDPDDPDSQDLLFRYPELVWGDSYLRPVVKIELGARSDTDPSTRPEIQPYLTEALRDEV